MKELSDPGAARLLLALLREDVAEIRTAASGTTGPALVALAQRHRIGPYLHFRCATMGVSDLLPHPARETFAAEHRQVAFKTVSLLAGVRPLLAELNAAGIEPIALKGPALLGRVYPDPGARAFGDVDLMIPKDRYDEARRMVAGQGFRYEPGSLRAGRRETFEGPPGAAVDLHWELSQKHRFQADIDSVWRESLPMEIDGARLRRLCPSHEFVYLALHYASHYFSSTMKWLVDLRELLRVERLDPDEIAATAARWRGTAALHFALRYLADVYGDALRLEPYRGTLRRPVRDVLIRPFLSENPLLLVHSYSRGPWRLLLGLLFVDRPTDMIRLGMVTHLPD